ncbi:MAG: TonB-dependent receptor [Acidobacteriota bacterium]|nr:TonB-dependent receptor [Acidobacteriota bacterium]
MTSGNLWKWSLFLCCFFSVTLVAQEKSESLKSGAPSIPEVVVTVTATKYETPINKVAASLSVITAEELQSQSFPNQDLGDALRDVPGITLRRAYAPFPSYINIRGATESGTVVLVNGLPTNWEITQAIPIDAIERVEILRGPASALYGANAVGGAVNIITKKGKQGFSATAAGGYGSFDTKHGSFSLNGGSDRFTLSMAGSLDKSHGTNIVKNKVSPGITMIDDDPYEKQSAFISAAYQLPNKGSVSVLYNFFHDEYTRGRPNVGGDWYRHFAALSWQQPISDKLDFKASVGYRFDDLVHLYDNGGTNYALKQRRFMDYSEIPLELQLTAKAGMGHELTGGFFVNRQETDQDYKTPSDAMIGNVHYNVRTTALFIQDVWAATENLSLTAGLRFDRWRNYDNTFYNFVKKNPGSRTDSSWSPKLGVKYIFGDRTNLWASYAKGFLPPTPEQLFDDRTSGGNPRIPNPDLKPENTHSWETGISRFFGKSLEAKATGFYAITKDKILSWFDSGNIWTNKNIGETRSYGIETDLVFRIDDNWAIKGNYTWNNTKVHENPVDRTLEGKDLPFAPHHKANLGVLYTRPYNFTLGATFRYLDDQETNDRNTRYTASGEEQFMRSSHVVDISASKYFRTSQNYLKGFELVFNIDNLFNEEYRTFYIYEDPGRVFYGELRFHF